VFAGAIGRDGGWTERRTKELPWFVSDQRMWYPRSPLCAAGGGAVIAIFGEFDRRSLEDRKPCRKAPPLFPTFCARFPGYAWRELGTGA
jgi:hypothetical protein